MESTAASGTGIRLSTRSLGLGLALKSEKGHRQSQILDQEKLGAGSDLQLIFGFDRAAVRLDLRAVYDIGRLATMSLWSERPVAVMLAQDGKSQAGLRVGKPADPDP